MKDDLISRQQAIDALDCINGVEEVLRSLPSAQPEERTEERTETHACDLISRKEVLKAIDGYERISAVSQTVRNMTSLREIVQWLPPAQPEPTDEQVAEYCKRRCLHIVTDDFFYTVQPEPKWIPVSERLPRDGSWNIFTDGKNISVERYKADAIDHFFPNGRWFDLEDAIAWMPLPDPYKGGQNG